MYEIWPKQYNSFSPGESRSRALVERFGVSHAFASIVPDPRTGALLVRRYGVPRSRVLVIATCPELPSTSAAPRVAQPLAVYYHGTLHAGRGVENLVRAMAHVDGAVLSIRGIGPLLPVLQRIVEDEALGDRVRFLPALPVEELAAAGTAFDVGVSVACPDNVNHRFSIGFKTFENLAAGLALVSTRSRVLGPFTQRHDVGLTFEGCSVPAIAEALRYCVAHPAEVARWKQRSRALAEREFNPSVQGAYLRELVARLTASRGEVPSLALGERPV
jgi:glycosyltransferase involved in cell wall biosynthesis